MLQTFCNELQETHIHIKCDNTSTVACINRMASTKPTLMALMQEIWLWAIQCNITLSAEFYLEGSIPLLMNNPGLLKI